MPSTRLHVPHDLCIYQDIVLAGQTVERGQRDCAARWALIEPCLPRRGTVLDVGSNFGWFGLQITLSRPEAIVASFEADERSAAVQHAVLTSNQATRVVQLSRTFRAATLARWAAAGQRLDAVLLLAVLHWLPDHAEILAHLNHLAGNVFLEHPAEDETNVGRAEVMQAIGSIEACLRTAFPTRPLSCLGEVAGPGAMGRPRRIWHVGPPTDWCTSERPEFDVETLLAEQPVFPPRSWWQAQTTGSQADCWAFTPTGLAPSRQGSVQGNLGRRLARLPETYSPGLTTRLYRSARRRAGTWWRRCRMAGSSP